jgi:hypothetical protein
MDRLAVGEELHSGQELISSRGWFAVAMAADGNLVVYRRQTRHTVWLSGEEHHTGGYAVMQGDGNFVAQAPDGTPYWSTDTSGNDGAWLIIHDDGNLVVYNKPGNQPLWTSQSQLNLDTPTIEYRQGGFTYDETSEKWKDFCSAFPCFIQLQWPGYATAIVEDVIDGQEVVIQLWTGLCQQGVSLPGAATPGGIGSEVGVYRRMPGRIRPPTPASLPFGLKLPAGPNFLTQLADALTNYSDEELWWPFPELGAMLEFTFINPVTGEKIFRAGPQQGYWLTKWMEPASYDTYRAAHPTPRYEDYILEYRINGKSYRWWPADSRDPLNILPAISLLLSTPARPQIDPLDILPAISLLLSTPARPRIDPLNILPAISLLLT